MYIFIFIKKKKKKKKKKKNSKYQHQFIALVKKNILLKKTQKYRTFIEIFILLIFMLFTGNFITDIIIEILILSYFSKL